EEAVLRAAARLREVHRSVGVLDQLLGRLPVVGEQRDTGRGGDGDRPAFGIDRRFDRLQQFLRDLLHIGALREPGQQHHELVAAEAGDIIVRTMNSTGMRWPILSISTLSYAVSCPDAMTDATFAT